MFKDLKKDIVEKLEDFAFYEGKLIKDKDDVTIGSISEIELKYEKKEDKVFFTLLKDIRVRFMLTDRKTDTYDTTAYEFWCPKGMISDGASIPRVFLSIVRSMQILPGAIPHDYLFSKESYIIDEDNDKKLIRDKDWNFEDANLLFFKILRHFDVSKKESFEAYRGVSTSIGRKHWEK